MQTDKYGRTYHFPFSPGVTNDDRVNNDWLQDMQSWKGIIVTEKLDGENTCLTSNGVYARSHAALTDTPWSQAIRINWATKQWEIPENIEIFGENLEGIHSIEYKGLTDLFYVFAVRDNELKRWLSWEDVCWYADIFNLKTVPVIAKFDTWQSEMEKPEFWKQFVTRGAFDPHDSNSGDKCSQEGLVVRNADAFDTEQFQHNVIKFVRPNHVQTDTEWTKTWKRAKTI